MFTAEYYETFLNALTDRASIRNSSMETPEDAIWRTFTDDGVFKHLMNVEVCRSIEQHGFNDPRWEEMKYIRRRLTERFPERPDDCEKAGTAYSILFQDVQQRLYEGINT